ncbi:AI-2E family transporter YdiK [Uliginosibacterium sp. 31-16]|uniref:AI-2E family transporter YdiK n=1 Tax=Uliginosibacterium sp. 31-16 TaxID=3068315 RepID=UPI00273FB4E2|nr:AI-2E family transporter YdiK [Uliginosibacterium sp. 31-16]MDP5238551.1 AI-2E family transporter YdiK [Uliginosibacterium sp. 31-16]
MPTRRTDLARTLLSITITGMLLLASLWVLSPFVLAITWATMIVVASWPLLLLLERRLWGRRWLAVTVMISALLTLLFLPFTLATATLIDNADQIIALAGSLKSLAVPEAPGWLSGLPYVGEKAAQLWAQGAALGLQELAGKAAPYAGDMTRWFATKIGHIGLLLVQIALAIVISAILYAQGEVAAAALRRLAHKLGGQRGEEMIVLAAGAIRGVALGVGVTALVQAILGGIGLALTGIPFIAVLTALMFMLCIAQLGVLPVLAPAVIFLYWNDQPAWATFLLIWMLVVVNLDNFLRPWLIKRGADLPLLLILAGVIGGIISFGLVGIFLGPLLLAVSYTLLGSWLGEEDPPVRKAAPDKDLQEDLPETGAQN